MQNPANPCKPAGAGEAQKKEGKGCRSTYATRVTEGQAPGDRKGRKSPSEPAAGEAAQTAGPGGRARHKVENQATHHRHLQPNHKAPPQEKASKLVAEPTKGKLRQGKRRRHKVENQVVYQDTANPTTNVHCRSRSASLRVTSCRTRSGKPQVPQEEAQKPPQKRPTRDNPTPSRRRERRHSSASSERNPTHTQGPPEMGATAKTHKASHRRIEISGE